MAKGASNSEKLKPMNVVVCKDFFLSCHDSLVVGIKAAVSVLKMMERAILILIWSTSAKAFVISARELVKVLIYRYRKQKHSLQAKNGKTCAAGQ